MGPRGILPSSMGPLARRIPVGMRAGLGVWTTGRTLRALVPVDQVAKNGGSSVSPECVGDDGGSDIFPMTSVR